MLVVEAFLSNNVLYGFLSKKLYYNQKPTTKGTLTRFSLPLIHLKQNNHDVLDAVALKAGRLGL